MAIPAHPDDLTFRRQLRHRLVCLRKDMGLRQVDLGPRVGRDRCAGKQWEGATDDWRVGTVDLWVRSLDHRLVFDLGECEVAPPTIGTEILRASQPGFNRDVALALDQCRRMRVAAGLTVGELAAVVGVGRTALSHWEAGRSLNPRISSFQRYVRALGGRFELGIRPAGGEVSCG